MGLFETATAATMCRSKMSPLTYHTPPAIEVAKTKIAAMDQFRSFQIQDSMDGLGSNLLTWSISSLSSPIFFRIPARGSSAGAVFLFMVKTLFCQAPKAPCIKDTPALVSVGCPHMSPKVHRVYLVRFTLLFRNCQSHGTCSRCRQDWAVCHGRNHPRPLVEGLCEKSKARPTAAEALLIYRHLARLKPCPDENKGFTRIRLLRAGEVGLAVSDLVFGGELYIHLA